jgi:predicted Zn-dependent protease
MRYAAAFIFSVVSVGTIQAARACDSAIYREFRRTDELYVRQDLARLNAADDKLQSGKADEAYRLAVAVLLDHGFRRAALLQKAKAHRIAAQAALALGRNGDAIAHFGIAVEALPELASQLAAAQIAAGHLDDARNELERRSRVGLLDATGWAMLARIRRQTGDTEGAKTAVAEALQRNPESAEALRLQTELVPPTALAAGTTIQR